MVSKRNSRVFVDEAKHCDFAHQKPSAPSHRPRRDSHDDGMALPPKGADEGQFSGLGAREAVADARTRSASGGARDKASGSRFSEKSMAVLAQPSLAIRLSEFPPVPLAGRPANFGVVVPGVYRSSYPKPDDFPFLQNLKLKTVITLVKKDDADHELESFMSANGIRQVVFNMKGTKKEAILMTTMASILRLVLDRQHYPLLVHCNHGRHRTGCVVAVARKLSGWDLDDALGEYRSYAMPKVRECDVDFISSFHPSSLQPTVLDPRYFNPVQTRTFFRTLLFSAFVVVLCLVSGSKLKAPSDNVST